MEKQDRRREERIQCVLGVEEVNDQPVEGTYLLDIASFGAQMETNFIMAVGDSVKLSIAIPATKPEDRIVYHLSGQVVWIKEGKSAPERHRIGLSFFTPYRETAQILEHFRYKLLL